MEFEHTALARPNFRLKALYFALYRRLPTEGLFVCIVGDGRLAPGDSWGVSTPFAARSPPIDGRCIYSRRIRAVEFPGNADPRRREMGGGGFSTIS